jgi:hypothetical protein
MPIPTPPSPTFRPRTALAVGVGAVLVGTVLGGLFCMQLGWAEGRALTTAAGLAGLVWLAASILAGQVLIIGTGLAVDRLGMGVLASSMARMFTALFAGLIVYMMLRPEGRTFWVTFLAAGLAALVAEAVWAIRTINSPTRAQSAASANHGAV